MHRNPTQLTQQTYDLLVIGGGIHGACLARDAALRGLTVALVEKGDFGQAASANSLKTIHGGLRYLQDADLSLMRQMIRERTAWLRTAPHLVQPLPCLMPTYPAFKRSKTAMAIALKLNDWISYDRNQGLEPDRHLPAGQIISRAACLERLPGLAVDGVTGGAIWHDAQMYNSERLLLSVIFSAAAAGAVTVNYVAAANLLHDKDGIQGIEARDTLTGQRFQIKARLVANCAGGWTDQVLGWSNGRPLSSGYPLSIAINLVTRKFISTYAAGIPSRFSGQDKDGQLTARERLLFVASWRGYSLVGTLHLPYHGRPQDFELAEDTICGFVDELNVAYPGANLAYDDVYHVHWGFLPAETGSGDEVKPVRRARVIDHEQEDGLAGLISVIGVKYTTARAVAQAATDLALKKLGRPTVACQTEHLPLWGGDIDRVDAFLAQAVARHRPQLSAGVIEHLVRSYGSEYSRILRYLDEDVTWGQPVTAQAPVLKAEIIHACRCEMAQTLLDVLQRRTELGAAGRPDEESLRVCAGLMATELNWDQSREAQEIEAVRAAYAITQQLRMKKSSSKQSALPQKKEPWQLEMFRRSLKKQQKLETLLDFAGSLNGQDCLLVTCGDNNGALNWHFRAHGGRWVWADVAGESIKAMSDLLAEPVQQIPADAFPFGDQSFDCVVSIDVLEHLASDQPFLRELKRVLRPTGRAIVTVPNGDPGLWANRIKWLVGMTPEVYGHTRAGYTVSELSDSVRQAGLEPLDSGGYSRFFTEMMELIINFGYVFMLSRKKKRREQGQIAPSSAGELKTHGAAYRLYTLLYPAMKLVSQLDRLLPAHINNAVVVSARNTPEEVSS